MMARFRLGSGANNNNMAAIQPESPEGKIMMKVFDKANNVPWYYAIQCPSGSLPIFTII